jgi:hypothetical protein
MFFPFRKVEVGKVGERRMDQADGAGSREKGRCQLGMLFGRGSRVEMVLKKTMLEYQLD